MTTSEPSFPPDGPAVAEPNRRWRWLRGAVGLGLLLGLVIFARKNGTFLYHLAPGLMAQVVGLAALAVLASGALLAWIARGQPPPARPPGLGEAVRVAALGSFANAAGGLPVGTAMVFGTLVRQHRCTLAGIATGKALGAVLNIGWMLLLVALGLALGLGGDARPGRLALVWGAGLGGLACLTLPPLVRRFRLPARVRAVAVFQALTGRPWAAGLGITGGMAAASVALYAVVFHHYLPAGGWGLAIGWAATSLVLGFLLSVNTVGGAQEIVAGLSGMLFQLPAQDGVGLALVVRLGNIVATGAVAGLAWWVARRAAGVAAARSG